MDNKKIVRFSLLIMNNLADLFDKNNINYIGEINDDNVNEFMYSLMLLAPNKVYNKITGSKDDLLDSIGVTNKLIVSKLNEDHKKEIDILKNNK